MKSLNTRQAGRLELEQLAKYLGQAWKRVMTLNSGSGQKLRFAAA